MSPLSARERVKLFRQNHLDYYREYNRNRMRRKRQNDPEYVARERMKARQYYYDHRDEQLANRRCYYAEHKKEELNHSRNYYKRHSKRVKARNQARYYIPLKNKCEICGSTENLQRHHPDYSKSLQVMTVCKKCHIKLRKKYRKV